MREPDDLYRLEDPEVIAAVPRGDLTMVVAIPGMVDAGGVCRTATGYLRESLRSLRVASFTSDELIDYRSSRPTVTYDGRRYSALEFQEIALSLLYDDSEKPFLLLDGPEPDLRWHQMTEAIINLCDLFDVQRVISMRAVPSEAPHSRTLSMLTHANEHVLAEDGPIETESEQLFEVPGSFVAVMEVALERAGIRSQGFIAQIPHYLTRSTFPAGALALLRRISATADLELPLVELGDIVETSLKLIDGEVAATPELQAMVESLEEGYDQRARDGDGDPSVPDMPTADELGDRFERFLAENQDSDHEDGDGRGLR